MKTCAENVPIEIWLCIFNYLDISEIFHSFSQLNQYFNSILTSEHLLFHFQLTNNSQTLNFFSAIVLSQSKHILHRLIYVENRFSTQYSYLLKFLLDNAKELIRLRYLTIKLRPYHERLTFLTLRELHSLTHLSLGCTMTQTLFEGLINLRSVRICKLIYRNFAHTINTFTSKDSRIEILTIKDNYNQYSIIKHYIRHMSNLKKLCILCLSTSSLNQFGYWLKENYFLLQHIQCIHVEALLAEPTRVFFEQLHSMESIGKSLKITMGPTRWNEDLLKHMIHDFWILIENIRQIQFNICGYLYIDSTRDDIRQRFDTYHKKLQSKSCASITIKWTERPLMSLSTIIEINLLFQREKY